MGIFSRLSDIVNSNINSILDRAEDPKKMIRLIIQEMEETLVEDTELNAIDEHLVQLEDEVVKLQAKLTDAKAKQKVLSMREQTVNNRLNVKRQVQKDSLDNVFKKFELKDAIKS